ncbi:hypothetical protein Tco_1449987 [Tanacetum coccineum]
MATTDKESSAAGTDNRPPMLEKSDFESWKIRIERYIRGKPLGKLIWKSIKNGHSPHPMITVTTGEGEQQTQVTREKTDEEFTEAENNKERADIQLQIYLVKSFQDTSSTHSIKLKAGAFLADVECTTPYSEPLAITTTTAFKVTHEDAYDSDIDEAPYAAAAFMANRDATWDHLLDSTNNEY